MSVKPNLFIVGLPRCGTTSLYDYLSQHPDIFVSTVKEPHFFGSDLIRGRNIKKYTEKEYLKLFEDGKNKKIKAEASTAYILSENSAQEIYEFNPSSKIIIMLRDPVECIHSLFYKNKRPPSLKAKSFVEALAEESELLHDKFKFEGLKSSWSENGFSIMQFYLYRSAIKRLPERVEKYLEVFGRENVMIVKLEDMSSYPKKVYREILGFLKVDENFAANFEILNSHESYKIEFLENFIHRNYRILRKMREMISPEPLKFVTWFRENNKIKNEDRFIPPALKQELSSEFSKTVKQLEKITDMDFNSWYK